MPRLAKASPAGAIQSMGCQTELRKSGSIIPCGPPTLIECSGGVDAQVHHSTSANFERSKDQKIVAKVLVTCELTICGLGSHSATGEEWTDNDNAGTSAEAQAFKRACSCYGLGRYLHYFTGALGRAGRTKAAEVRSATGGWATPAGWLQGPSASSCNSAKTTRARSYRK
jgi:hypothetical protein